MELLVALEPEEVPVALVADPEAEAEEAPVPVAEEAVPVLLLLEEAVWKKSQRQKQDKFPLKNQRKTNQWKKLRRWKLRQWRSLRQ